MSKTIDERVVEMRFDNKHFESNVSTTMSTLDKLKSSLNLTGATKGLDDVSAAARNCDVSAVGRAAEAVGLKFNAMYTIADQALRNITNSAVNAGKRIVSALTIDPIKTGFSEYETQINAIQTILANTESKGTTLNDVNGALDELNAYADKTIYNFTEMTRNIGTFTAAGVDLDTSVSAIKGIANLAAVSGSNSQQASTAMYQLSQAMASGTVKLMDWNSVVNAGMGGQVFQDALKETARVHGVAIDDIINKQGSFRESLSEGWLTTEILTDTLAKFTGDLSEEQLKAQGYTDEQIKGIQKLGQTANDAATKVKTFSQLFDTLKEAAQSGWTQTWEILVGDFEEAKEMLTQVSDTIGAMIGKSAEARNTLLENWKVLGGRDKLLKSFVNIFEAIMKVVEPIGDAFRDIFPPTTSKQLFELTERFASFTEKLIISDSTSNKLKRTFKGLFAVVDIVKEVFVAVAKGVGTLFGGVSNLGGGILDITASFGDWLVSVRDFIKSSGVLNSICQGVAEVLKSIANAGAGVLSFLNKKFISPGLSLFGALLENISTRLGFVGTAASDMKSVVVGAFDNIGSALENCTLFKILGAVWKAITAIASGITKAFGGLINDVLDRFSTGGFSGVLDFINSLISGGLGVSLILFIKKLKEPVEGLGDIIDGLTGCFEAFQTRLKAGALMKIATAIAILTASLLILSLIDGDKLSSAISTITILFIELMSAMSIVSKVNGKGLTNTARAMVKLSTALLILAIAMKILGGMSLDQIGVALLGVSVGLGVLIGAVNLLPDKKVASAAKAIKKMATALLILSLALKIMGTMSLPELGVALLGMAAGLGILVAAVHLLPKDIGLKTIGILSLATAMVILAAALKIMGTMSWEELGIGLAALAGSLLILAVALNFMTAALPGALAMLIVAPALVVLSAALIIMGSMSWDEIARGLVALGGALLILAVGLTLMIAALPGAAALLVASAALAVLAPVLILLGGMSWEAIGKGLLTIAGAFAVIGVAGLLLAPIVPAILGLAGALVLLGVGILAAGAGLILFGTGLTALAVGFTSIVASLSAVVTGIISLVTAVIVGIATGIGEGLIAICQILIEAAPTICEALTVIITCLCEAIVASVPKLVECIHALLSELLKFIVDFVPELVTAGIQLIVGLLDGIASKIGDVIAAATRIITEFLEGIGSMIPKIVTAAIQMMINFVNGLAEGIRETTPKLIAAVNNLMSAVFEAIGAAIGNIPELGRQIINGLIKGIKSSAGALWDSLVGVVKDAWNGVLNFLGIASPSKLAAEAGRYVDEGLAVGLNKYAKVASRAALNVGKDTMSSLTKSISDISDAVNSDVDAQPVIRPVLDLSDVKSGAGAINGMLDTGASVGVLTNVGAINSMMNRRNQNGGTDDVVSAINKLRKDLGNVGNTTYHIDGVTYDDGSNISEAVKSIVRAARIERRV